MVLPVDASCEDLEVDPGLPFLNSFVQQATNAGGNTLKDAPAPACGCSLQLRCLMSKSDGSSC